MKPDCWVCRPWA